MNLPRAQKMIEPRYQDRAAEQVTLLTSDDGASLVRVIAGELAGARGPGSTYTPITMAHATISPGARLITPWNPRFNALVYVLGGRGTVGAEQRPLEMGQLALLDAGDAITIAADARQDGRTDTLKYSCSAGSRSTSSSPGPAHS